jgi:hypothetical protein
VRIVPVRELGCGFQPREQVEVEVMPARRAVVQDRQDRAHGRKWNQQRSEVYDRKKPALLH